MVLRFTPPSWLVVVCTIECGTLLRLSLPNPTCTIFRHRALPSDFMWHQLVRDMLGNCWLGALSRSNRVAITNVPSFVHLAHTTFCLHIHQNMFCISQSTQHLWYRICWELVLRRIKITQRTQCVWCVKWAANASCAGDAAHFLTQTLTKWDANSYWVGSFIVCFCSLSAQLVVCP